MKLLTFKTFTIIIISGLVISGINNTIEMNSSALDNKKKSVKTVDELTDHLSVATSKKSFGFDKKNKNAQIAKIKKSVNSSPKIRRIEQIKSETPAYIQDNISLELTEYYNPNKFSAIIKAGDANYNISGFLEAANGIVETIDVTLPNGESIFVEYGEMKENRFVYSIDGSVLRGIIYKIDAVTYMVSLDEGPHAGTRLKFKNTQEIDTTYEEPVDTKTIEASIAAQEKGFTF